MSKESETPKPSKDKPPSYQKALKFLAGLLKELGMPGFLVVAMVFLFFASATDEQKQKFIDKYYLLENYKEDPVYLIIVAVLIITGIISTFYYKRRTKMLKEETKRIGRVKSEIQEIVLRKELHSSEITKEDKQ